MAPRLLGRVVAPLRPAQDRKPERGRTRRCVDDRDLFDSVQGAPHRTRLSLEELRRRRGKNQNDRGDSLSRSRRK
jgi:hypothetical protein